MQTTDANLVLTGFMATGKTTVARILGEMLEREVVDSDDWIVEREGRSVARIFREEGEEHFRRLETEAARALSRRRDLVISTGGRLMLDPVNAELLEKGGRVVCLTARPETILARLGAEAGGRPLLAVPDPVSRIRELLAERAAAYGRFHQVATDGLSPEQVAQAVLARLP